MNEKRLRWLMWWWRIIGATYVAGVLTLLPYGAMIVIWTALLFTPLLVVTLATTRSKLLAYVGIPVVATALIAALHLILELRATRQVPRSPLFTAVWFTATIGPIVLYPLATRHLSKLLRSASPRPGNT